MVPGLPTRADWYYGAPSISIATTTSAKENAGHIVSKYLSKYTELTKVYLLNDCFLWGPAAGRIGLMARETEVRDSWSWGHFGVVINLISGMGLPCICIYIYMWQGPLGSISFLPTQT